MRIVRKAAYALAVLALAGSLSACGGDGDSHESKAVDQGGGGRAPAATDGGLRQEGRAQEGAPGRPRNRRAPNSPPVNGREVVHMASLRVKANDVEAAAAKAKQLVTAVGGYVERESSSTDPARSEIALKIPATQYTGVLNQLATQLGKKLSLTQEAEDVTGEVADVQARVRSAEATLASFRKLLERANSVSEIINIENEIAEREADLEALQAREKTLKHRTAFATVTVTVVSEVTRPTEDDDRGGFVGALDDGWDAFTAFLGGIAVLAGWLLPFLVAATLLAVPVVLFRPRLRTHFGTARTRFRRTKPTEEAPPPST
ncbi:uncharacterized protein DUF4349 [Actinomadura pelletieri DSM 43383]|uniref:Uncharacterized protein DUF4349 n=1 Tax=Actinomadura pelletieri DSM 43383 TaxID=1120940 RepID=A0A495QBC7_9ACTN|nr:DUF4349 domain-containing protein [Actinomadura pelletieri]RKS68897.1 uncharacterized protein DUF4349 [Actinomadura pelletieri DSM 43383]